jgi:NADH-quinone oxidoreductase subunit K
LVYQPKYKFTPPFSLKLKLEPRKMINLYVTLAFILFILGILGIVVNRKNIIILLMSIELMLLAINFLLITISTIFDNIHGQLFALYILVVAAAESAIGLSILVAYYRVRGTIAVKFINLLRY